jgi:hypothetical protein
MYKEGLHAIKHPNYCGEKVSITARMFTVSLVFAMRCARPVCCFPPVTDIFLEILTGKVPFHEFLNDMTVILQIIEGKRPTRPVSCSGIPALDSLWELLQNCWEDRAEMRPTAPQIVKQLIGPLIRAKTTSSMTEWDDKFTSKFRHSLQAQSLLPSVSQIDGMFFGDG